MLRRVSRIRLIAGVAAFQFILIVQIAAVAYCGQALRATPLVTPVKMKIAAPDHVPQEDLLTAAVRFTEPFEGRRLRAYTDSTGHRTIGVGFNLDRPHAERDLRAALGEVNLDALRRGEAKLTDAQVSLLFRADIEAAIRRARREITSFDALPRAVQLILVDMTFNLGSLSKWPNFRRAIAQGDYAAAAHHMADSRWSRQTGRRAQRHIAAMRDLARNNTQLAAR